MRRFWRSSDSTSKRVLDVLEFFFYLRLWKIIWMYRVLEHFYRVTNAGFEKSIDQRQKRLLCNWS